MVRHGTAVALALCALLLAGPAAASAPLPNGGLDGAEDFFQLASSGFLHAVDGDHPEGSTDNTYAWSGAWFRGKFYVGTGRNLNCFRTSRGLPGCPESGLPGAGDRAEIWAYTPAGVGGIEGAWKRVHRSSLLMLPLAGAIPRDLGYRGMTVCPAGGPARVWVATLGVGGHIVWSEDGETFSDASSIGLHNSLAELVGGTADIGFRALACWHGRLLAAPAGAAGDGDVPANPVVFANSSPAEPTSAWDTIVDLQTEPGIGDPNNVGVFSMTVFRDALYLGVTNLTTGFEVWKGTGCENPAAPCEFSWQRIVENGAGRPRAPLTKIDNGGVTDVAAFRGAVYFGVSSSSFFNQTTAEVVRVNTDGTFDLIMGMPRPRSAMPANFNCRAYPEAPGLCVPLSGMGPGFGQSQSYEPGGAIYVWRLTAFGGYLYAGLGSEQAPFMRSQDGERWDVVKPEGLLEAGAFAVRTLVAAPTWPGGPALLFGTVSASGPGGGAQAWVGTCAPSGSPEAVVDVDLPDAGARFRDLKLAVAGASGEASVTLDGSGSSDPFCGRIDSYEWYQGDLTGNSLGGRRPFARTETTEVTLPAGTDFTDHAFTLRVVDHDGNEDRATVTIRASRNEPPSAVIETDPAAVLLDRLRLNLVDLDGDGIERFRLRGSCADPEGGAVTCTWTTRGGIELLNPSSLDTEARIGLSTDRSAAILLVATDDHGFQTVTQVSVRLRQPDHDVAVEAIVAPPATAGIPRIVTVTMRNDGHFTETTSVSLADETGGLTGPASRTLTLAAGAVAELLFTWTPAGAGAHLLRVSAVPVAGERIVLDNERGVLVPVGS